MVKHLTVFAASGLTGVVILIGVLIAVRPERADETMCFWIAFGVMGLAGLVGRQIGEWFEEAL